jgi:hypothetical protein
MLSVLFLASFALLSGVKESAWRANALMIPSSPTTTTLEAFTTPSSIAAKQSFATFYVQDWVKTAVVAGSAPTSMISSTLTRSTQLVLADSSASPSQSPPTQQEILLLRQAFSTFYGTPPNPRSALPMFDQVLMAWERQPADEKAGLYRVRADCQMALKAPEAAIRDYSFAIDLLRGPGGELADPVELSTAL